MSGLLLKHFINGKASIQATKKTLRINAKMSGPLAHGHFAATVGEVSVRPRVVSLRYRVCPAAVIGRIVSVHVNSIELVSVGRPGAQVSQEDQKVISPLATHGDASSAVVREGNVLRTVAPGNHFVVSPVFRSPGESVRFSRPAAVADVLLSSSRGSLRSSASAASCSELNQTRNEHLFDGSTCAPTANPALRVVGVRNRCDGQIRKLLPYFNDVLGSHQNSIANKTYGENKYV